MGRRKQCIKYKIRDTEFIPQAHQSFLVEYMFEHPEKRGLLLYHGLGSGKTCSAILIADLIRSFLSSEKYHFRPLKHGTRYSKKHTFGGLDEDFRVIVFSTGSLRQNFISEYCEFCGINRQDFEDMFKFYSYNYSKIDTILPDKFKNSIIIVDEVHNIINGFRNDSKTFVAVYNRILHAVNCKVILLSGTPLVSYPIEISYILNLLKPKHIDPETFDNYIYTDDDSGDVSMVDEHGLRKKLRGFISYVKGFDEKYYPTVIHADFNFIPMSDYQLYYYIIARQDEDAMIRKHREDMEKLRITNYREYLRIRTQMYLAWSMMKSRQRSNFVYPKYIQKVLEEKLAPKKKQKLVDKLPSDDLKQDGGWIDEKQIAKLNTKYSPKFAKIIQNILKLSGKHACYSYYKTRFGVHLIKALLKVCGINSLIFSGDLDDAGRRNTLAKFNDTDNLHGEKYKAILFTQAGIEGITLMAVRHFHIVESDKNESDIRQAMGRVVRYKSHHQLPIDERNVTIHRYFSIFPKFDIKAFEEQGMEFVGNMDNYTYADHFHIDRIRNLHKDKKIKLPYETADIEGYEHGTRRLEGLEELYQIIREEAIDAK